MERKEKEERKKLIIEALSDIEKSYKLYLETFNQDSSTYSFYDFIRDAFEQYKIYTIFEYERRSLTARIDYFVDNYTKTDNESVARIEEIVNLLVGTFYNFYGDSFQGKISDSLIINYLEALKMLRRSKMGLEDSFEKYRHNIFLAQTIEALLKACYYQKEDVNPFTNHYYTSSLKDSCAKKLKQDKLEEFTLFVPAEPSLLSNFEILLAKSKNPLASGNYLGFALLLNMYFDSEVYPPDSSYINLPNYNIIIDKGKCDNRHYHLGLTKSPIKQ